MQQQGHVEKKWHKRKADFTQARGHERDIQDAVVSINVRRPGTKSQSIRVLHPQFERPKNPTGLTGREWGW
jgi:hypothetical protein